MDVEALRKQITEQVQTDFESQVRELRRQKNNAEEELDGASERWRLERRRLKTEIDRLEESLASAKVAGRSATESDGGAAWQQERDRLRAQVAGLEASLAENVALLDQLRREYDAKLQELVLQNEGLRQNLEGAGTSLPGRSASLVDSIEVRLHQPEFDSAPINAEMQRVQESILAIENLLEHPDTTASMMARKNIERAENEAYLRGLNFQLARAKGA
jgi:chromosome segregation ATPase